MVYYIVKSKDMKLLKSLIYRILSSPEKRVVVENFFSLSLLQTANYILPLVTLPYLVRVLGPGKYGLIAFAQALIQYFILASDYGFTLSATREISVNRSDGKKVSEIFSSVMAVKFILGIISLVLLCSIVVLIPKFNRDWPIYICTFGLVIGNLLFPTWFLQGIEKMKHLAVLNVISKAIFTVLIFVFVKNECHYIRVPIINSFGYIVAGLLSLWVILKSFNVKFIRPSFHSIVHQLKEGWHVFISRISISLYTTTNTFVLGLFTNDIIVGYYAAGEKLIRVVISFFEPVFQAFYPYISKLAAESKERAVKNLATLLSYTFIIAFLIFLIFVIWADHIVLLILGKRFIESTIIIRILSPLLFIVPVAYIFANLTLLPFKLDKYFSRIYVSGGLLNLFLLVITLYIFGLGGIGAAFSSLSTEIIVTAIMYIVLKKHGIKIFYGNF